jgi:aspartyl-tRNA(Asn)/glutamyl-tRNA(Gln) amidotransferase subunit A
MTSSTDTMGVLSGCVEDSVLVSEVISGVDVMDSTTKDVPVCDSSVLKEDVSGLKIGIPKEYVDQLSDEMKVVFGKAVDRFKSMGCEVSEISLPMTKYGIATYYVLCPSEVSANMERYDGIRFGMVPEGGVSELSDQYFKTRDQGLGAEVKRRILIGTYALSAGYYDAYYRKAQKVRTKIIDDFKSAFESVDVILTPAAPDVAFKIGEKSHDPLSMYLEDAFMVPASLAGLCAVSVPSEISKDLPVGVQLIGPQFGEGEIFGAAYAFEKNRGSFERKI